MEQRKLEIDPWKIVETGFDPRNGRTCMASESLFSIGNGAMGGRANFEEHFSGQTLPGNYLGGIYYPDKTRVGWWKNGYPEYFAKVLNSAFWPGVDICIGGQRLDLAVCPVEAFRRELDMRRGLLSRTFVARVSDRVRVEVCVRRFVSMAEPELGTLAYELKLLSEEAIEVVATPFVEGDVRNEDANYDEKFWELCGVDRERATLTMRTRKTGFEVSWAQRVAVVAAGNPVAGERFAQAERVAERFVCTLQPGESLRIDKFVGVATSMNHAAEELTQAACAVAEKAAAQGFEQELGAHEAAWEEKWSGCDVAIDGDDAAQQGIRFCIFQLLQTYTGRDSRLNVGPKGFTGEKYGGSTYWDTEAYCLPFYLCTSGEEVARQLLRYRYRQLPQAIENAAKLGFRDGAALYPMVTMTGEECHNEWEITFEEIHRNGAIAYAIYNYCRYTGTRDYLLEGGLEVLIGIARFWAQRATYSEPKDQYVILGVTGPNEYENNVNNNWYTNFLAGWCLQYALLAAGYVAKHHPEHYRRIVEVTHLNAGQDEFARWRRVADGLFLPEWSTPAGPIFLQQEGYMDKEQRLAKDIPAEQRPINQHWSWDRILRSCFIKQADVLQGLYFFQEMFDLETIARNFDFYEPRTVHESSLSPCVHSILASLTGRTEKAYELYLRTARLDLDDYNHEVHEGLHITSMAGSWLSVIEGFGGVRVGADGRLHVRPRLPRQWRALTFEIHYRGAILRFEIGRDEVCVASTNGVAVEVVIGQVECQVNDRTVHVKIEA